MKQTKFQSSHFGREATDKITGFKGIVTARVTYMYGCEQYLVTPPVSKDGQRQEGEWFDIGRLDIDKKKIKVYDVTGEDPGCDTREYPPAPGIRNKSV